MNKNRIVQCDTMFGEPNGFVADVNYVLYAILEDRDDLEQFFTRVDSDMQNGTHFSDWDNDCN